MPFTITTDAVAQRARWRARRIQAYRQAAVVHGSHAAAFGAGAVVDEDTRCTAHLVTAHSAPGEEQRYQRQTGVRLRPKSSA
jgi:hypothetical protein